jgi:two-component system, NarL family, nitrate/nitrite response regulator NarL
MHRDPTAEGPQTPIRILVVDDHDLFRSGLRRLLNAEEDLRCVGEASSATEAIRRAGELRPDVVVMDLNMPGGSGIGATRAILETMPETAVLMLTVSEADGEVLDAVLAGASGYLLKDATLPQIVDAVHAAAAGQALIAPQVAGVLLERLREHGPPQPAPRAALALSARELDVLRLLASGSDNGEIARSLHLSPSTIKHHVSSIFEKLGVDNRVQAAVIAVREGLLD